MVVRTISEKLLFLLTKFPIVTLTGTRQSGKSTLLKSILPHFQYISLEDFDIRQMALEDPRGFLSNFKTPLIIDEAQHAPQLFSYIQTKVDAENKTGMYVLSGSQNFLLMQTISQSLAGRTAVLRLPTFSISELKNANLLPNSLNEWLFNGGYPRIYDKNIAPADFFPSYVETYIERDVRLLRNINNMSAFIRFIKLCAARCGQLFNLSSIANECDISVQTAQSWISILETSYVIYLLKPYYNNFGKRLIKSPKIYFYDTGLVSALLGLTDFSQLATHYLRGNLFENMVVSEIVKKFWAQGKEPPIYFWQDSNQNEVDLLIDEVGNMKAIEIKSNATMNEAFFIGLKKFQDTASTASYQIEVVYGGDVDFQTKKGKFISWKNV